MLLTLVDQIKWDSLVSCIHFLDRLLDLKRANERLSKKWMQGIKESHFFDPPKLETLTALLSENLQKYVHTE